MNTRRRKRLFQDALFFDGFAFRHRETTKNSDFSVFFWRSTFTARVSACASARDEVGSVASRMCASAEKRPLA